MISTISLTTLSLAKNDLPDIKNYWLQAAPPNAQVMAAYVELSNNTNKAITLSGAYSPAFEMTMIHKTLIVNGIAKMLHQDEIKIDPGEKLVFKSGSYHIMLMRPKFKINQGDKIKIHLIYQQGDQKMVQEIWFPVEFR
ncbi:MAG: copper chaperone PCu(A)C [Proteobacteria bacterium]|nr:copper chaperone PCu(A)C [Pseudomonadota bacterium]